jgi:hypothetical protein
LAPERAASDPWPVAVPLLTYFFLVLTIWGPFALCSGMPYETTFLYNSESLPGNQAFFYVADPLRIHTNTFYHLSYLLGEAIRMNGSFVPFQIVYAALWWARGSLVFLILRKLLPGYPLLCFLGGALTLVHASDGAVQWVGQLNQFGFIFWMLLGFLVFIHATEQAELKTAAALIVAACFFEYMSLWSYEAQFLMIVAAPLTLLLRNRGFHRRLVEAMVAWYAVAALYVGLTIEKYLANRELSYQFTVMRPDLNVSSLLADLGFNMYASLAFWDWPMEVTTVSGEVVAALSALAVLFLLAGGVVTARLAWRREGETASLPAPDSVTLLATGIGLLALSFPAYLLLANARSLWRTQLLSGVGAAVVLIAAASLLTWFVRPANLRAWLTLALGGLVVYSGSTAVINRGSFHASGWEKHRACMRGILGALPSVESPVMVLLVGFPRDNSAFAHNMWFDFALRLAYPGAELAGMIVYDDQTLIPGANMKLEGDKWVWDETAYPPMISEVPASRTVVIHYGGGERMKLLGEVPGSLLGSHEPVTALVASPANETAMSVRAANRYLFHPSCCRFVQQGVGP